MQEIPETFICADEKALHKGSTAPNLSVTITVKWQFLVIFICMEYKINKHNLLPSHTVAECFTQRIYSSLSN